MKPTSPIPLGRYRHYKGADYLVVDVARHSETLDEMVVYRQDYGDRGLWVRPRAMFFEPVTVEGRETPRFRYLGPDQLQSPQVKNLFAELPADSANEIVETLLAAADVRVERIVSNGQASPDGFWYDQDQNEWVVVLRGSARLRFEDATIDLKAGDSVNIPAHRKHRVDWTTPDEPTVWLAIHYGSADGTGLHS